MNTRERNMRILKARTAERTLQAIADRYGMSRERIRQICLESDVKELEEETELWRVLSDAAARLGISRPSVTRAYRAATSVHSIRVGRYDSDEYAQVHFAKIPPSRWHELPACGKKTLAILSEAFGGKIETE